MIEKLIAIGQHWQNIHYPLRQEAVRYAAPEFCLSPASFSLGLDWIFGFWNAASLTAFQKRNAFPGISSATQILAGNTPAVMAQAFLHGAILNVPQTIKAPRKQRVFPRLLYQSFKEIMPEVADKFFIDTSTLSFAGRYPLEADLIIAYGNDTTLETIKAHCAPTSFFLSLGHAVSCAVIFKEAATSHSLKKLAWDMLSYDQRGCLSPLVTFVQEGGDLSPAEAAAVFAHEILPEMALQLPRGGLFPGEAEEILQKRALYGFRGKVYTGSNWTVTYDEKLIWPEEMLPRFMPFKSFQSADDLLNVLSSMEKYLISIGYEGNENRKDLFRFSQLHHVCHLGEMQKQLLNPMKSKISTVNPLSRSVFSRGEG